MKAKPRNGKNLAGLKNIDLRVSVTGGRLPLVWSQPPPKQHIFVAGRYGVPGFRSGSVPRTRRSVVAAWFPRSRPYDRLLHKSSENSPPSASGGTTSANTVPGSSSGVADHLLMVFIPLSGLHACVSGTGCFASEQWGRKQPISPFRISPDSSRNEPRLSGQPWVGGEQPLHQS